MMKVVWLRKQMEPQRLTFGSLDDARKHLKGKGFTEVGMLRWGDSDHYYFVKVPPTEEIPEIFEVATAEEWTGERRGEQVCYVRFYNMRKEILMDRLNMMKPEKDGYLTSEGEELLNRLEQSILSGSERFKEVEARLRAEGYVYAGIFPEEGEKAYYFIRVPEDEKFDVWIKVAVVKELPDGTYSVDYGEMAIGSVIDYLTAMRGKYGGWVITEEGKKILDKLTRLTKAPHLRKQMEEDDIYVRQGSWENIQLFMEGAGFMMVGKIIGKDAVGQRKESYVFVQIPDESFKVAFAQEYYAGKWDRSFHEYGPKELKRLLDNVESSGELTEEGRILRTYLELLSRF